MLLEYKVSGIRLYDKENKLHLYDIIQFGTIKRNYLRLYRTDDNVLKLVIL